MNLHYSLDSAVVLDTERGEALLGMLKDAGVDHIWLWGYFFGKLWSPIKEMKKAAEKLRSLGFEVGVIQLPVGHPGNGLNPEDDSLDLKIPDHWNYRIDREGKEVFYCADINDQMIADNLASIQLMQKAGFDRFFIDDDLRMGNWGTDIQGSFDETSLAEFNDRFGWKVSRAVLSDELIEGGQSAIKKDWITYNCGKVTRFMAEMAGSGAQLGLMVMHLGDERHGIDIAEIKQNVPDCLFRVGESHFADSVFETPQDKADELFSVLYHLDRMGRENAFSETTIFPPNALSESNFIFKAKMALAAGVQNILFMSGTWLITERYWHRQRNSLQAMRDLDHYSAYSRVYPVHIAYGTAGFPEAIHPNTLPLLAGLPALPVKSGQVDGEASGDGECLLFFGPQAITSEWEQKFASYRRVILDQAAYEKNRFLLEGGNIKFECWMDGDGSSASSETISNLQRLMDAGDCDYPRIANGSFVALIWLKEADIVILLNLAEWANDVILTYRGKNHEIKIDAHEMICQSLTDMGES